MNRTTTDSAVGMKQPEGMRNALKTPPHEAVERLEARRDAWSLNSDAARVSVRLGDLRTVLSLLRQVEEREAEWQSIDKAPRDGTPFYARHQSPYRWQPYKPSSEQYRRGKRGRWQTMTEYGGWENCPEPVGDWKPHPDFPVVSTALTHSPETDGAETSK